MKQTRPVEKASAPDNAQSEIRRWQDDCMKLSHQVSEQTAKLIEAEKQRDELLAAAKEAVSLIKQFDIAFEDETDEPLPIINKLQAAIQKAEVRQ